MNEMSSRMRDAAEDLDNKQKELDKARRRFVEIPDDGSVPESRRRAIWDKYFLRRIDLIKAALGSLESASKEIGGYADKILELISGIQDDVSALKKQLASESKLAQMKSDGRKLYGEYEESKKLLEATDPSHPDHLKLLRKVSDLRAEFHILRNNLRYEENAIGFYKEGIDRADKLQILISASLKKAYDFVSSLRVIRDGLENGLKLAEMQREGLNAYPEIPDVRDLSDFSKRLDNVLRDLDKGRIELPPDTSTPGGYEPISEPIRTYSDEELRKLFPD